MAVRVRHSAWAARPGHRVLLRQHVPLGKPLLWVPLVPGGPRVNEATNAPLTYSNLTATAGIAQQGGGFVARRAVPPQRLGNLIQKLRHPLHGLGACVGRAHWPLPWL